MPKLCSNEYAKTGSIESSAETIIKPLRILTEDREGRGQGEKTGRAFGEAVSAFVGIDIFWNTISDLVSITRHF